MTKETTRRHLHLEQCVCVAALRKVEEQSLAMLVVM